MTMPWRDIVSNETWSNVVANYSSGRLTSRSRTIGRSLRSLWNRGKTVLPKQVIRLNQLIPSYHAKEKSDFNNIEPRIGMLFEIAETCEEFCKKYNINNKGYLNRKIGIHHTTKIPNAAESRAGKKVRLSTEDSDLHKSLDLYMYSIMHRAVRKAQYLSRLENLYLRVFPSHRILRNVGNSPKALIDWLRSPIVSHDEFCRLHASVRLEQLDPAHRAFELTFKNGQVGGMYNSPLNLAFCEWAGLVVAGISTDITNANPDVPFFLWLENHPMCTAASFEQTDDTLGFKPHHTTAVEYARADKNLGSQRIAMLVSDRGLLYEVRLGSILDEHAPLLPFDTFTPEFSRGKPGEENAAAYVWAIGKEIFAGAHETGRLHHTTFVSGRKVRCAGMLGVRAGKVVFVSNNSGHYKPHNMMHLKPFVDYLRSEGVFAPNAKIQGFELKTMNVNNFLMHGTRSRGSISLV